MTTPNPIAPDDTAALAKITAGYVAKGWTSEIGLMIASNCASAVARAVCPPNHHVIADGDLRAMLDLAETSDFYGSEHDEVMRRLRALVEEES